jgi:hypothetical protein
MKIFQNKIRFLVTTLINGNVVNDKGSWTTILPCEISNVRLCITKVPNFVFYWCEKWLLTFKGRKLLTVFEIRFWKFFVLPGYVVTELHGISHKEEFDLQRSGSIIKCAAGIAQYSY